MAGFRKAKAEQAALKYGIYGASGRGKTLSSLLIAEGLVAKTGKRIAFVDTEHGTDFYAKDIPERRVHPKAFDFDAMYTRSITDITQAVRSLNPEKYGVVIIDSMTHIWEAARAAYTGKKGPGGQIPLYAWGGIKKPYKDLVAYLLNSTMHVIFCGREGKEVEEDDDGEMKVIGSKMKAEGETPYEPHVLIHMMTDRDRQGNEIIQAHVEKDRSGVLKGKLIQVYPSDKSTFDLLAAPLLPYLGDTQAQNETEDEQVAKDAEAFAAAEADKIRRSEGLLSDFSARIHLAKSCDQLKAVGKELTPELKRQMMPADVSELRARYQARENDLSGARRVVAEEVA